LISSGYLLTPAIEGKSRWFKLSEEVQAELAVRNGVEGCLLVCHPKLLAGRGIDAGLLLDTH
jgi:hypothetical protein